MAYWWKLLKKDWKALTRPSKVATILSLVAIIVTILNGAASWQQINRQNNINSSVATFSANAQSTSVAQFQRQIELQGTQIAMQNQMDEFTRWQGLPLIKVANLSQPVLILEDINVDESSEENLITGSGIVSVTLANDGGGGASLIEIDLINSSPNVSSINDLSITNLKISKEGKSLLLPMQIEGQSAVRFDITVKGKVSGKEDVKGLTNLGLGIIWKEKLTDSNTSIEFIFSNVDDVAVPLSNISLGVQFQELNGKLHDKEARLKTVEEKLAAIKDKNSDEARKYEEEINILNLEILSISLKLNQLELKEAEQNLAVALHQAAGSEAEIRRLEENILRAKEKIALLQTLEEQLLHEEQLRKQRVTLTYTAILAALGFLGLVIRATIIRKSVRTRIIESQIKLISLSAIRIGEIGELKIKAQPKIQYTPLLKFPSRSRRLETKVAKKEGETLSWAIQIHSNAKPGRIKVFMEYNGHSLEIGEIEIKV